MNDNTFDNANVSITALDALVPPPESTVREKVKRGFAAMDPTKVREYASRGGKAAWSKGTAHKFTKENAREIGRKGGLASKAKHEKDPSQ